MKQLTVIVCSTPTKDFIKGGDLYIVVDESPKNELPRLFDNVIAVGGGAVVDTAKMLAKKKLIVYPTTAAGAGNTSHSVVWGKKKKFNVKTIMPTKIIVKKQYFESLPAKITFDTYYDAVASCMESKYSVKQTTKSLRHANKGLKYLDKFIDTHNKTYLIKGGNESGKAIEITSTNVMHSLSYPLTSHYGIPHGEALGYILKKTKILALPFMIIPTKIDWELVIKKALKYHKIHETTMIERVTTESLREFLHIK